LVAVAEGDESQEQSTLLRILPSDQMRRFLISKPLPFDAMAAYLPRPSTTD
jgi:EAL domain-containing protein (putative c-di-GMP-specific phosphodiesterase class I)